MYKFSIPNQSPWIQNIYNQFLPYKTDGFLVEIGVGHTIEGSDWFIGSDPTKRVMSNTADLLDIGWSGIYIDPVKEFCDEAQLCHKNSTKLRIINLGCSDIEEEKTLYYGDSFIPNNLKDPRYVWFGRKVKCLPTSTILTQNECPENIDIMSIDVEGYEIKVLSGINFNIHKPKIIIIEINQHALEDIIQKLPNYVLKLKDNLNAVFVL